MTFFINFHLFTEKNGILIPFHRKYSENIEISNSCEDENVNHTSEYFSQYLPYFFAKWIKILLITQKGFYIWNTMIKLSNSWYWFLDIFLATENKCGLAYPWTIYLLFFIQSPKKKKKSSNKNRFMLFALPFLLLKINKTS